MNDSFRASTQDRESNARSDALWSHLGALDALPRTHRRRVEKRRLSRAIRLHRAWWRARQDDAEIALNFLTRASVLVPGASHYLLAFVTRRTREAHSMRDAHA